MTDLCNGKIGSEMNNGLNSNFTENNKSCCVCLKNVSSLRLVTDSKSDKLSPLEKLQINISDIEWKSTFWICEECINILDIVQNFRDTCIRSEIQRQECTNLTPIKKEEIENNPLSEDLCEVDSDQNDTADDQKDDVDISEPVVQNESEGEVSKPKGRKRVRKFACDRCSATFFNSKLLTKHCIDQHDMSSKDVRPYGCSKCESRFTNSSNLLQHMKYHAAIRTNICSYCGKGFITKTDLNIHEKQHLNKREYGCEICNKFYNTHKDLRSHKLVVHTDPSLWKYFCKICNKHFPIKSNYDCHMRRHTGDKRFECHLCCRKFTDKCVLQRHMRTHTNIRDYKCHICSREYKDKRVMQIHMAKVHQIGLDQIKLPSKERKYQCNLCPKAYYAKNKLTRHLYTHSGEKPFFCTVCNKKFNDKSYVTQHMKKTHNIDTTRNR